MTTGAWLRMAVSSAASARSGVIASRPRAVTRAVWAVVSVAAKPVFDQRPQAIDIAGRPRARRQTAKASSEALAAA